MTLTPQQALRLSRADTLAKKHASAHNDDPANTVYMFTAAEVAALIEEVTAPLRKEINDACLQAERDARDAYSQGEAAEADRHQPGY